MANVKQIRIDGVVPFNWLMFDSPLDEADVAFVGSWFLTPSAGLAIQFTPHGYRPNNHGGKTALYAFAVSGREAVSYAALDRFKEIVVKAGGEIRRDVAIDLEDVD